jgi:hypothetical protein
MIAKTLGHRTIRIIGAVVGIIASVPFHTAGHQYVGAAIAVACYLIAETILTVKILQDEERSSSNDESPEELIDRLSRKIDDREPKNEDETAAKVRKDERSLVATLKKLGERLAVIESNVANALFETLRKIDVRPSPLDDTADGDALAWAIGNACDIAADIDRRGREDERIRLEEMTLP